MHGNFYTGVVENRDDPLLLGRCQVRIVGLHTEDKNVLPTTDLPWAYPLQPITSAAMNGIGWTPLGPVQGTWVVVIFRDDDQQQPIMIGTVGGIPQSKASEVAQNDSNDAIISTDGGFLTDSSGNQVTTGDGTPVTTGSSEAANKPAPTAQPSPKPATTPPASVFDKEIPLTPPSWYAAGGKKAIIEKNMQELVNACNRLGLTSKYAKCAILAICGGESGWQVVEEGHVYRSPTALMSVFPSTFGGKPDVAKQYANWQGSKADFFKFVYSPQNNGKGLGHKDPNDGALYYGRGFNQITGKSLYKQLEDALKKAGYVAPLLANPQSMMDDPEVAAMATVMFYKLNVKHDPNDPGYFVAARKRTGNDANGGYAKKQKYYDYFFGAKSEVDSTDKPQADAQKQYTPEEIAAAPPEKRAALSEDRSANQTIGFCDPNGKYPLREHVNEPDTNRLARGVLEGTAIAFKDATRIKNIPIANSGSTWQQPQAPYNSTYPYNKVYETESGHIQEFDDSPGGERINIYHRKGSFIEIDPNGSQVNRIVGDGYTIIDRNGAVFIGGKAVVTISSSAQIFVGGSADIQVNGDSTINLKNDADIGVAGDLRIAVGNDLKISAGNNISLESGAATAVKTGTTLNTESGSTTAFKAATSLTIAADTVNQKSEGSFKVNAGGNLALDGSIIDIENGSSDGIEVPAAIEALGLTAPEYGDVGAAAGDFLEPPERNFAGVAKFEDHEDFNTPEGQLERQTNAAQTAPEINSDPKYKGEEVESSSPSAAAVGTKTPASVQDIRTRTTFPTNYTLSKHFVLANFIGRGERLEDTKTITTKDGKTITLKMADVVENLAYLAENILEPIYEIHGPTGGTSLGGAQAPGKGTWQINDSLRTGSGKSEHYQGCAVDVRPINPGAQLVYDFANSIVGKIKFNQFLLEYRAPGHIRKGQSQPLASWWRWVHISFNKNGCKNQIATMLNDGDKPSGYFKEGKLLMLERLE